ncbi:exporter of polyketide antibiotics [Acrocarpospora phusangensis]|uniref:Exporter of polyketide antibiotics n=1 Tax=Acrocarpospora phusangensis TaxID=1070424 RepID=A0A919QEY7_9ACTN|nr:ABC transporter permease [Acrocarpospora phusangensis]GIH27503.1 exporter of polyketide antibiotics [Acrocarpospora phusangensis]
MTGTWHLIRLILRRDRVLLPLWLIILAALPASYAASYAELLPDDAARHQYAVTTAGTPSFESLLGPLFGDSTGALTAQRVGTVYAILALISLLTVIRHTRTEEDAGRRELIAATVVGRHAALSAALIVVTAANLLLALLITVTLAGSGLPAGGSLLLGLSMAVTGIVFAAVGALTAQLTENAGPARGLAIIVLGGAFLIRAAGDPADSWLSWLSPLAWGQQAQPYADEKWWALALPLALAAVLAAAAYRISVGRDVGAGVLPARLGPAGSASLASPFALAWRLQRGLLLGWSAGLGVAGLAVGGTASAVMDAFADNPQLADIMARLGGGASLADAFVAGLLGIMAIAVSAYGIQAALRMRAEETGLRAEPVLATATGRVPWALSHVLFAVLGPAVALLVLGVTLGISYGVSMGDVGGQLPRVIGAALVQLPAVAVLTGLSVALFGLLPRLSALAWGALGAFLLLGQIGAILQLDPLVLDVSPFTHTPRLPGGTLAATPVLTLSLIAALLIAAGLYGFRRRDIG